MSVTPPILYSGPTISPDVDWNIRRHLQLIYQKLGNHTQAFALLPKTTLSAGTTKTGGVTGVSSGGTGNQVLPQNGLLIGNGAAPVISVSPLHTNDVLTDNGPGSAPSYQGPLIYEVLVDQTGTPINGRVSATQVDCLMVRYR